MNRNKQFERLLEPYHIGSVKTRNRIIKSAAGLFKRHGNDDLGMGENMKAFYESVARGGVGILFVEAPVIDYPLGTRFKERYRIDDDKYIPPFAELVKIIHKYDCPTFMQMNHDGPWQVHIPIAEPVYDGPPVGASPISLPAAINDIHHEVPRQLSIEEIEQIVDKFASAAVRAQKAGFDGVDINAGSSHLLHNFLSPFWNKRTDMYGGTLENRARFFTQIIKEIKKRLGNDFPVSVIINGIEIGRAMGIADNECLTVEDGRGIARLLEQAGADAIMVRSHWLGYHIGSYLTDVLFYPEAPIPLKSIPKDYNWSHKGAGANILLSEGIKKVVNIPVTAVAKIDPILAEQVLKEHKADFISMTRALIADPDLPNKLAAGKYEDIQPCTRCENCLGTERCRINAFIGTGINKIEKAPKKRKVVVVGGGPAGMKAAQVAGLRGHEVTLYEKSNKLGGLLSLASLVKGKDLEDLPAITKYFSRQLNNLGVKIRLGKEVDLSAIEKDKPDVVIVATGGIAAVPDIRGIEKHIVIKSPTLHRMLKSYLRFLSPGFLGWATKFWLPIGKRVIVIGSGIHGSEIAEFLVKRGRTVIIVDKAERPGAGVPEPLMGPLFTWFYKKGVRLIIGVKDMEITDTGLKIVTKEGKSENIEADNIIPAIPSLPDMRLYNVLKDKAMEIYAVGDCKEPRLIVDAISEGSRTAQSI